MQTKKKEMKYFNRRLRHKNYVENRVTELRHEICMDAIHNGDINQLKRHWLLKYNEHLKHI
jgi:hypothetical protein